MTQQLIIPLSYTDFDILVNKNENYKCETPPQYNNFKLKINKHDIEIESAKLIWNKPYKESDNLTCTIEEFDSSENPFGFAHGRTVLSFFTDITYENVPEIAGYTLPDNFARLQVDESVIMKQLNNIAEYLTDAYLELNEDKSISKQTITIPIAIHTYDYDFAEWMTIDAEGNYLEEENILTPAQQDAFSNYFFDRGIPTLIDTRFRTDNAVYIEVTIKK